MASLALWLATSVDIDKLFDFDADDIKVSPPWHWGSSINVVRTGLN